MSSPSYERTLQREQERQRRQREGGLQTDWSDRLGLDIPDYIMEGDDDVLQEALNRAGVASEPELLLPDMTSPRLAPVGIGSAPPSDDELATLHRRARLTSPPAHLAGPSTSQASPRRRGPGRPPLLPRPQSNAELRRTLDLLRQDEDQRLQGRNIHGVTHTNTITTVYKDNRSPETRRISTRTSGGRTVAQARRAERQRRNRRGRRRARST